MDTRANNPMHTLRVADRPAWFAFGLWLRAVLVGIGVMATGVALLLQGSTSPAKVLSSLVGGTALAAFSWHRAKRALERAGHATASNERVALNNQLRVTDREAVAT